MSDIISATPTIELRYIMRADKRITDEMYGFTNVLQQKWTIQRRAYNDRGIEFDAEWRDVPVITEPSTRAKHD